MQMCSRTCFFPRIDPCLDPALTPHVRVRRKKSLSGSQENSKKQICHRQFCPLTPALALTPASTLAIFLALKNFGNFLASDKLFFLPTRTPWPPPWPLPWPEPLDLNFSDIESIDSIEPIDRSAYRSYYKRLKSHQSVKVTPKISF